MVLMNIENTQHRHNHIHGISKSLPVVTENQIIGELIAKDALLRQDNLITRQSFQGRFIKTSGNNRKNRSGNGPEQVAANIEYFEREQTVIELAEAAAAADTIIETGPRQTDDFVGEDPPPSGTI
jgi:hypothetical protein